MLFCLQLKIWKCTTITNFNLHGYHLSCLGKYLILCLFFIHSYHYVLTHMGLIGIICLIMLERKTFFISVPFVAKYTFVCSKVWYYSAFHCVTLLIMIQYYNSRLNLVKGCNIEQHRKPMFILGYNPIITLGGCTITVV